MTKHFNDVDARALHGLIAQTPEDIVVRLDPAGFIIHASSNADRLGIDLSALLLMPHISDLAEPEYVAPVAGYALSALGGEAPHSGIEFPLAARDPEEDCDHTIHRRRWYSFSLRAIEQDDGAAQGGLGVLRSVEHKHAVAHELSIQAATDPLTGLANRRAFCGALARVLNAHLGSECGRACPEISMCNRTHARNCAKPCDSMAIFAIDRMQAIFMQYGEATADEIRWGFSRFLETMTHASQDLAQLDDERFAVLLPGMSIKAARDWAADVLSTFAGLTNDAACQSRELTASAGLARVELSVDWTLRQAELGLVMARAGGGMRAGVCSPARRMTNGAAVERAMDAAVERATRRQI